MNHSTTASGTQAATGSAAAGVAAGSRERSDPRVVLADRVEQLYSQLPLGIAATVVIGLISALELREGRIIELVAFWGGLLLLVSALHAALYFAYRRSADKLAQGEQWLRWLGIGAFAAGVTWGFGASVFFPSHADERQVFLAFLLSGVMSGGIPVYAASWPIFAAYAAGIAIPFTYVLATFGNRLFAEIALQLVELEEARRQVEASGRKLALFAERAPIAVLEIDPQGIVTAVNHAAELLFGYAAGELIGGHVKRLVLPELHAEFDGHWMRMTETRQPLAGLRIRNPRRDGIALVCEWTVTPLVNPEGNIVSVIAQGQDVTRQIEAERIKKEFTSTLSHELRTPLTSIIGSLQLANSGVAGELSRDVSELTLVAERNAQRLLDIINDILDIEKIESGTISMAPEVLAIDGLVREAIVLNEGFGERFKVRFEARGELPGREVYADRKRLLQVMTNLLSNAAKFSPEWGKVDITLEESDANIRVGVHDRGPVIPEEFRSRIFGRFAQADSTASRQKGGTGLGLAICKRMIELMHGRIGFEDRAGGGTTFWFELPKHPRKEP